jgi:hypothetical protein
MYSNRSFRRSGRLDSAFMFLFVVPLFFFLLGMVFDIFGVWNMERALHLAWSGSAWFDPRQPGKSAQGQQRDKPQTPQRSQPAAYASRLSLSPAAPSQPSDTGTMGLLTPGSSIEWSDGKPTSGRGAFSVVGPEPAARSSIAQWRSHLDRTFADVQDREDNCRWWRDHFYLYESNHGMLTLKENLERYCR